MISEKDITAFVEDAIGKTPETPLELTTDDQGNTVLDMKKFINAYTESVVKILSDRCDQAWYFDAANLIRSQAGIPVSVESDTQLSMKLHPEDDPE